MFVPGQTYNRFRDIHAIYGGQQQGGIATPARYNLIFAFTGESGKEYGYRDGWSENGTFLYTGEGQYGDMQFIRGNKAIRDHRNNNKELLLFESDGRGSAQFIGNMTVIGHEWKMGYDTEGTLRKVIVFELIPEAALDIPASAEPEIDNFEVMSLAVLRERALASASIQVTAEQRITVYRHRSLAIKQYALRRSNGICGGCEQLAPFRLPNGNLFLEVHHLYRLSDSGEDHPNAVIALCPNCHRRAHYAVDANMFNESLKKKAKAQEEMAQVLEA